MAEYSPIADEFFAVGTSHTSFFKVLSRMASIESLVSNFCVPRVQFLLTSASFANLLGFRVATLVVCRGEGESREAWGENRNSPQSLWPQRSAFPFSSEFNSSILLMNFSSLKQNNFQNEKAGTAIPVFLSG